MKKIPRKTLDKIIKFIPVLTIDAIIKSKGKVLLIKRDIQPCRGYWHLCGGFVLKGERLEHAVKREALEETGMKVRIKKFVGFYDDPKRDSRGHVITLAFLCEPVGGKMRGSEEGREVKFFKRLPEKIAFDHRKILRDVGFR